MSKPRNKLDNLDIDMVLNLMSSWHGRRFLDLIEKVTGVHEPCSGKGSDVYVKSAKQEIGLYFTNLVKKVSLDKYQLMQRESTNGEYISLEKRQSYKRLEKEI